jgi:hypothetical protein
MSITPQQRAAKTRSINKSSRMLYEEISKPAHEKVEKILNNLLGSNDIRIKWVGQSRLKNGVTEARLMRISHGGLGFTVHIDGYRTLKEYSSRFWDVQGLK